MKQFFYGIVLIIALAFLINHFRPVPPPPVIVVATPTPTPAPTPNPAKGAIQAAVQMYPDLGKKGSTFNLMFLDAVDHRKKSDPDSLVSPEWPLLVADEVGHRLGINPLPIKTPTPTPPPIVVVVSPTPKYDDPLSKGAYDKHLSYPPTNPYPYYTSPRYYNNTTGN